MKKFIASGIAAALTISVAMPAFAESGSDDSSSSVSSSSSSSSRKSDDGRMRKEDKSKKGVVVDSACMQAAVEKRDSAIIAGVDTYTASVKAGLQTRKDAIKAAWALTDKTARNNAMKAAWAAFQGTWKKASQGMKAVKKTAWQTFRTDAKACGQTGADSSGESVDASL